MSHPLYENGEIKYETAIVLDDSITTLVDNWYVVKGYIPIIGNLTVSGHARLILADDCELVVYGSEEDRGGHRPFHQPAGKR